MIDRIIEFSIRNRALVIAAGLALALWGVVAVYQTPVDAIPDLSENQVIVFTDWAGRSPREIEDQVTYPLSLGLQGLAGVKVVRSSSDFNFSSISVIFNDSVDFATARQRVAERLVPLAGELPDGVAPQLAPDALATGQIFWYTVEGAGYDLGRLRTIQDWYVRPQLASVPGVAEVASVGGHAVEFQIEVDPLLLRTHGVTMPDVLRAVSRSNSTTAGHVVQQANAEYLVRAVGWLGQSGNAGHEFNPRQVIRDLEDTPITTSGSSLVTRHSSLLVSDVAVVSLGGQPRRGVLEKDGNEVTGGVVLMRAGENPLEVTRRIKDKITQLASGLPKGVRIVPGYDRTPLITGAVRTVTGTLVEAIVTASICVLIVLLHLRTSFIIAVTLPLATLASFVVMWTLRRLGVADIQTNIMSLAGIAISIGVLVDSSIVMAENVMHTLREHFGDRPVRGDVRRLVLSACRTVGRPIFFSVLIMLVSFAPVFALGGMEGKMFRPLAFTKSFALAAVAVLAITLVPALCTIFIRGRLRRETDSWLVRSVVEVYRPVLNYLLDRPAALAWIMSVTFIVGLAPVGIPLLFLAAVFLGIVACGVVARGWRGRVVAIASVVFIALVADQNMKPLGREFITPLDEGTAMDMPITVPRASITQSADDLKARNMLLCRFPEVEMVMGKAGRAETATDPAPMDMIETMVSFRPTELWPRRRVLAADAERHTRAALDALVRAGLVEAVADTNPKRERADASQTYERGDAGTDPSLTRRVSVRDDADSLIHESSAEALVWFDNVMREFAFLRGREFSEELARSLARFIVVETGKHVRRAGKLERTPSDAELAIIAGRVPAEMLRNLEGAPLEDAVTAVVRHAAAELERQKFIARDTDVLADRPGPFGRVSNLLLGLAGRQPALFAARLHAAALARHRALWRGHVQKLNGELLDRAGETFTRLVADELLDRTLVKDAALAKRLDERKKRQSRPFTANELARNEPTKSAPAANHHVSRATLPPADPHPAFDSLVQDLSRQFASRLMLWPHERTTLYGFGSEMDRVLQMPGWTNVWTMPIQNRVDMLATGVNTEVGVRVLGSDLNELVRVSDEIAAVLKRVPGAAGVSADQIRGKGYLEVHPDRDKLSKLGLQAADVTEAVEAALAGNVATTVVAGRERVPVRVRYARDWRTDEDAVGNVLVGWLGSSRRAPSPELDDPLGVPRAGGSQTRPQPSLHQAPLCHVPLSAVADVRVTEGPATIKSENGMLRNYVRLNVRGRGVVDFVEAARRVVASEVRLPEGVFVEWTGQFDHQVRARNTLAVVLPIVLVVIFVLLYRTYRDWADAVLMMLAVPGAIAGGVFFQWLFGYKFSVTVWIGYIACFGMATATGVIMLVYLREAVAKAGGIERMSLGQLRDAVLAGAVQRLRPKLLTEGTTILGLAPMLWTTGPGAEVIRPMAAPVLGGILVADEVIDLFLPVLFYWVRRWRWQRLHSGEVCADNLHANESRRAETNHETSVSSGEAADRLAESGLIHSSFSPVEQERDMCHEAITQESAAAT